MATRTRIGAPAMMGRHKGVPKILKYDNPSMVAIHFIIHGENCTATANSYDINQLLKTVIYYCSRLDYIPSFK